MCSQCNARWRPPEALCCVLSGAKPLPRMKGCCKRMECERVGMHVAEHGLAPQTHGISASLGALRELARLWRLSIARLEPHSITTGMFGQSEEEAL